MPALPVKMFIRKTVADVMGDSVDWAMMDKDAEDSLNETERNILTLGLSANGKYRMYHIWKMAIEAVKMKKNSSGCIGDGTVGSLNSCSHATTYTKSRDIVRQLCRMEQHDMLELFVVLAGAKYKDIMHD